MGRASQEEGMLWACGGGEGTVLSAQTQPPEHLSSHGNVRAVAGPF